MATAAFTSQELHDLRFVFSSLDTGARGRLSYEGLRQALRILGFKVHVHRLYLCLVILLCLKQVTLRRAQQLAQEEGEGHNEVDEETYLQVVAKLQGDSYDSHGELEQAFALLDCDGDDFITAQDLQSSGHVRQLKLTAQEIEVGVVSVTGP